jgi:hypothetical protein
MKKLNLLLTTLVILTLSSAVFSQGPSTAQISQQHHAKAGQAQPPEMASPEAMLDHLSAQLNLTQDQKTKIKPIVEEVFQKMDQLHQDSSLTEPERHEKMKSIHENAIAEVKPILDADQQKKLDEMMSNHPQHHSSGGQDQGSGGHQHQ